jgi:O-methyltransferase
MIKRLLQSLLKKRGIYLVKPPTVKGNLKFRQNEFQYDIVIPSANYAPWLGDEEFMKIYQQIKENTLVDIYRCYELWELAGNIYHVNNHAGFLEVGVWRGGTAAIVGRKLELLNSKADFYLADTFTGVAKASKKDGFYSGGEHADTSQEIVENLLSNVYRNYKIIKGIFPEDSEHLVKPGSIFGFCHIDVDVYDSAKDIVNWIWDKMIVGGVIVFDDYAFHSCDGVTRYVNEQKNKPDRIIVHNLNGHAIMVKVK